MIETYRLEDENMSVLDTAVLMKNRHDMHLNVFWQYDGKPWLENNITKAFINTIDSLELDDKKIVFNKLFNYNIPNGEVSFEYYLQSGPEPSCIKALADSQKQLFAFSPTGKSWGNDGIDKNDDDLIRKSIEDSIRSAFPEEKEEEIHKLAQNQFNETKAIIENKGGSIPDAWILIYSAGELDYCIAMENKLYDLDPFQLNNHREKSLFLNDKTKGIKYCDYKTIIETIAQMDNWLAKEYVRYMYFLKYWDVTNLSQIVGIDKSKEMNQIINYYAEKRCIQLLKEVSGKDVNKHAGWIYKFDTNHPFIKQVGLCYNSDYDRFEMPLYFGVNQNMCWHMYQHFKRNGYKIYPGLLYRNSFHFQYKGIGKNTKTYYESDDLPIEKYIDFWIDNVDSIRQMDKVERHALLDKMLEAGIIPLKGYNDVIAFSDSYEKKLNVVPEIGVHCWWEFDKAVYLDKKNQFVENIKSVLEKVQDGFNQ